MVSGIANIFWLYVVTSMHSIGVVIPKIRFSQLWGLAVCKNSALSPDSLVLPLKVWKKRNKSQGMDSLCIQRALA